MPIVTCSWNITRIALECTLEYYEILHSRFALEHRYGAIGVQLFGGLIWEGNPALHNTTFEASGYGPNNFNDYASSLVTLFELLVVNNWMITMDGFVKASGTKWARMYFVSWWLLAVVIVLNIVIAYIVASFPKKRRELLIRNRDEEELKQFLQIRRATSTRFSTSRSQTSGGRSHLSTLAWLEAASEVRRR